MKDRGPLTGDGRGITTRVEPETLTCAETAESGSPLWFYDAEFQVSRFLKD
jgi:hypothetical protein